MRSHANARAFLAAYAETGIVLTAAAAAGVHRRSHVRWMKDLDGYKEAFEDAADMVADRLEAKARRRAVDGLIRYRFTKDGDPLIHPETKKPYFEHEYSDTLLLAQLKAKRPAEYRDRQSVEHSGPGGGPIETKDATPIDLDDLTDEQLDVLEKIGLMKKNTH